MSRFYTYYIDYGIIPLVKMIRCFKSWHAVCKTTSNRIYELRLLKII